MYCKNCDKEYTNDYKFCTDCGNKLEEKIENNGDIKIEKKEKVNPKELQLSAKVGYYTRKITLITYFIYVVIFIVILFIGSYASYISIGEYGIAFITLILALFFPLLFAYIFVVSLLNIMLPSIWIEKNKKVGTTAEVFRFIGLVVGYILLFLPLIIGVIIKVK